MPPRRGLTLLEILLATAIIAMIAAVASNLLRQSLHTLHNLPPTENPTELTRFADQLIANPEDFGLDLLTASPTFDIPWPEKPLQSPVHIRRLFTLENSPTHQWLNFTWENQHLYRFIPLDPPPEDATP